MHCFVINMDGATHRWQHIEQEFAKAGLQPTRFPARTVRDFPLDFFSWTLDKFFSEYWTEGEVGCLLSHVEVWKKLVAHDFPSAAIFEDDVIFGIDAKETLETITFSNKATIKKLETTFQPCFLARRPIFSTNKNCYYRLLSQHRGAGGYALNQMAARELLEMIAAKPSRADVLTFTPSMLGGRVLVDQLVPALVIQQNFINPALRDPLLKSTLSEERAKKALELRLSIWQRIQGRFTRALRQVTNRAHGRRLVIPYRDPTGRLIESPAK